MGVLLAESKRPSLILDPAKEPLGLKILFEPHEAGQLRVRKCSPLSLAPVAQDPDL